MSRGTKRGTRVVIRGVGLPWWFLLALPLAAALIVFVAQNTEQVTVHWTVWKVSSPIAVVVLVTIFVAIIVAEIVGVVWRRSRRRTLTRTGQPPAEPAAPERAAKAPDEPTGR